MASDCVSALEVRSLLQVNDSSLDLTHEEEEAKYGPLEDVLAKVRSHIAKKGLKTTAEDIKNDPKSNPTVDLVWDGWLAAYVLSKKENPVLPSFGDYSAIDSKASVVASFGYAAVHTHDWSELELAVGEIECKRFQDEMFSCFVKFVLSIFDEEDFQIIAHYEQISEEMDKFYDAFCETQQFEEFASVMSDFGSFSHLREGDFYYALQAFLKLREFWEYPLFDDPVLVEAVLSFMKPTEETDRFKKRALELIKEYRPLQGELKAQLLLELTRPKCFHVTDILILELLNGLKLPEWFGKYFNRTSGECFGKLPKYLGVIADHALDLADLFSLLKIDFALYSMNNVVSPMLSRFFCFKDEVFDVMKIANYERIMSNEPFISLQHILVGLSFSRIAEKVHNIAARAPGRDSSELYAYKLYKLSFELAVDLDDEGVGLEHFAFAIVHSNVKKEKEKNPNGPNLVDLASQYPTSSLFNELRICDTRCSVKSWRNCDVFTTIVERRCRGQEVIFLKGSELVKKLTMNLESGRVELPSDEKLRAKWRYIYF